MTEIELVNAAARAMRREGVDITPERVEMAVNAARGGASILQGRTVTGLGLTPRRPDGSGGEVVKHIRVGPKQAQQYAAPTPYFKLSAEKRGEYEAEAAALRGKIANPGLDPIVKVRLKQDLAKIQHLLDMDASPTPDHRPFEELRQQR